MRACIAGTGHYLPGAPISNDELIARHGIRVKPSFVRQFVGAETRHFAAPGQATSDLAAEAAERAIESSGILRSDISLIILATVSGDYPTPATACLVQRRLGLRGTPAMDLIGACSGFLQALDIGARCVVTGTGPVLVIGADVRSRQLNFSDPRTAFLYGDGAGAVVLVEAGGDAGIHHSVLTADGAGAEEVYIPAGGSREPLSVEGLAGHRNTITMANGRRVALAALAGFRQLATDLTAASGVALDEVSCFCIHQPNLFLVRQVLAELGIAESRCWINFPKYANTTSATLPIAMSEASAAGRLRAGEWVWLGAVGAGFAGAAHLVKWGTA